MVFGKVHELNILNLPDGFLSWWHHKIKSGISMQVLFAEYKKDYSSYTFSYAAYAVFRSHDEMSDIYESGFLPYTGNVELEPYLYYKARSLRIDLERFELGSENRRVARKFEPFEVGVTWIPVDDFDCDSEDFVEFCTEYSKHRFKGGEMLSDRLHYILHSPFLTHIISFEINGQRAGYVFVGRNEDLVHYWYSFYELKNFQELPLGKFMMMDVLRQAKEMGLKHGYLGTCYGAHSLYKVRDFKGAEFSDGSRWSSDIKQLKEWCKSEDQTMESDRFKDMAGEEANEYVRLLLNEDNS